MKLTKTKKMLLLGTTLAIVTTSIVTPIVLLNKEKNNDKNDVEKLFKILQAKTNEEKIIELSSNASGKIIADNREKIIEKIKTLIGKINLKEVKIEVLMEDDTNISIATQKIIIKLTKNEVSKEIKDFSVKKQSIMDVNKDIASIKKVLDTKTGNDLIITLPSTSTRNIIGNPTNKNAIIKKIRMLVDSSNINGEANHSSLKGTSIEISMSVDAPISTTLQDIIVSISKTSGTTLRTTKTFQVKRDFTPDEDIMAIKTILDNKPPLNLLIDLPSSSIGNIVGNSTNKNAIERKIKIIIDPSNTNGDPSHSSLRGTTITLSGVFSFDGKRKKKDASLEEKFYVEIFIKISKSGGKSLEVRNIRVKKL